jgi:ribosome-associated translation inhibitor RaiA
VHPRALERRVRPDVDFEVVCIGPGIDDAVVAHAKRKVRAAIRAAAAPVVFGRIKIKHEPHRSIERPAVVSVTLDVDGYLVRAHAAGSTPADAVDRVEQRLHRQLLDAHERIVFLRRRRTGVASAGRWRHGDVPTARPASFPRPPQEREVRVRKALAPGRCTPEDAAVRMEMLDHDFSLFVDSDTGREAVVCRQPDGGYQLSRVTSGEDEPRDFPGFRTGPRPPTLTVGAAVECLNETGEPVVFFVDDRLRGSVLYRRPDGHYGLVEAEPTRPADEQGGHTETHRVGRSTP